MNIGSIHINARLVHPEVIPLTSLRTVYRAEDVYALPPDLEEVSQRVVAVLQQRGKRLQNGMGVGIASYRYSKRMSKSHVLVFRPASYFALFGSHEMPQFVDDPDLQDVVRSTLERYERMAENINMSPLPKRPQLSAALVTTDMKTLVVKRSSSVAVASGLYHTSIVGGIRPDRGDCNDGNILLNALARQCREELGLGLGHDDLGKMGLLLALDTTRLCQPILAGSVRTELTAQEVMETMRRKAEDKWEAEKFIVLDVSPALLNHPVCAQMPAGGVLSIWCALRTMYSEEELVAGTTH